jgi:hypothetical protein
MDIGWAQTDDGWGRVDNHDSRGGNRVTAAVRDGHRVPALGEGSVRAGQRSNGAARRIRIRITVSARSTGGRKSELSVGVEGNRHWREYERRRSSNVEIGIHEIGTRVKPDLCRFRVNGTVGDLSGRDRFRIFSAGDCLKPVDSCASVRDEVDRCAGLDRDR